VYDTMYRMQYPRLKKPRKISDAVFRGKKSAYNFQVFPLTADIADTPAVFIISRRRTDKHGHGHQSAVCIGETNSILSELKKHKRAKCVKNNEPNVICVLEESNSAARAGVLEDLTAARKFGCIQNVYDSTIKPKSYETPKHARRAKRVVPEIAVEIKTVASAKEKASAKPSKKPSTRRAATPRAKAESVSSKAAKAKQIKTVAVAAARSPKRKQAAAAPLRSKATSAVKPARTKNKPTPAAAKRIVKAVGASKPRRVRPDAAAVTAKRPAAKRVGSSKPVAAAPKRVGKQTAAKPISASVKVAKKPISIKPKAAAKTVKKPIAVKSKAVTAKRAKAVPAKNVKSAKPKPTANSASPKRTTAAAGTRSRVQSSVDSNRRQHRLPKPQKPADKRAKSRIAGKPRTRQKTAA